MEILKIKTNGLNNSITKFLFKGIFLLTLFSGNKAQADSSMCYLSSNVGKVGESGTDCASKLIVDRDLLDEFTAVGSDFQKEINGTIYTFGNTEKKIFTGQITDFSNLFKKNTTFNADIGYWDTSQATTMESLSLIHI